MSASSSLVYFHTFRTYVKERWKNKSLVDVLEYEFRTRTREYYIEAIECGVITVNDIIVKPSYKLQLVDYIKHTVHMHEPIAPAINTISMENDYCVVYKPAGVPCHPTGGYLEYSVTRKLFGDKKVACVNRLDIPVSGVLIIAFDDFKNTMMKISNAVKIYIAKVKGDFPDFVNCIKKIYCEEGRRRFIDERGKECQTLFRKIKFVDGYSFVECRPITGRTHQIRIHLQSLGFPIVNDIIYGESKRENFVFVKNCNVKNDGDKKINCILKHCKGENNRSFLSQENFICLHAWKYKFNEKWYEAKLPEWAQTKL